MEERCIGGKVNGKEPPRIGLMVGIWGVTSGKVYPISRVLIIDYRGFGSVTAFRSFSLVFHSALLGVTARGGVSAGGAGAREVTAAAGDPAFHRRPKRHTIPRCQWGEAAVSYSPYSHTHVLRLHSGFKFASHLPPSRVPLIMS
jgi:hypothetical protein